MSKFKGTKTEKNLLTALNGESLARNRYTFYSEAARQKGLTEVADLFDRMGRNETAHASIWFKLLNDGIGDTASNIQDAANNENTEWRNMYPQFAETAADEGFEDIADMFRKVAAIEKDHEREFLMSLIGLTKKTRSQDAKEPEMIKVPAYRCMFCGAVYEDKKHICPVCQAQDSFESTTIVKEVRQ